MIETKLEKLKMWCQKVLPLVYDDSLSYYELLAKVVDYLNNLTNATNINIDEINAIKTELAKLGVEFELNYHGKWIFIGDDYSATSGWIAKLIRLLGLNTGDYFIIAKDGHGFNNNSWLNDVKEWVVTNTDNIGQIGNIIVGGGYNDYTVDRNELSNYINRFVSYCNETFIGAKVKISFFAWKPSDVLGYYLSPEGNIVLQSPRYNALLCYAECAKFGAIYLNGCECAIHRKDYIENSLPNEDGGLSIAHNLYNAIKNGSSNVMFEYKHLEYVNSGANATTKIGCGQSLSNNTIYSTFELDIELNGAYNITANEPMYIATIDLPYCNHIDKVSCSAIVNYGDGSSKTSPCVLTIDENEVNLMFPIFEFTGAPDPVPQTANVYVYFSTAQSALTN